MTVTNLFCEKCSLQFDKRIVYDIHLSFVHNIKENKQEKLTENYEKIQDLGLDSNSKNSKKKSILQEKKASDSDLISVNRMNLKQHIDSIHDGKKPHKCSICDQSFSQKGHLKEHTDSVHEGKKPHKCSICGQSFSKKGQLKQHTDTVHEGKKPHKCSICDQSFSQKDYLKRHIDSVHEKKKPHTLFTKRSFGKTYPICS